MKMRTIPALLICALLSLAGSAAQADPEELIALDFDDGSLDGFETYIEGGACQLANEDGQLAVRIDSCGKVDYANQAYWDGFSLVQDCEYTFSFDISCDIERMADYRIQLNGGDYHAYMAGRVQAGPQMQHVSTDFVMAEETDLAPRLAFNLGLTPEMISDPGAHTICIDNISLTIKDASRVAVQAGEGTPADLIRISQVGYAPGDVKCAVLTDGGDADASFQVMDEAGNVVYSGSWDEPAYDAATGLMLRRGDFSGMQETGTWYIRAQVGGQEITSAPFCVGEDVFSDLRESLARMLYLQRCGVQTYEAGPDTEDFTHGVCHDTKALIYGTDQTKDVSGGWHDAGDYGRYVVSGAKAVADLFAAYTWSGAADDDFGIPESGNGVSDLLDEARFELDWMLKMQDPETGGVYHKVTCRTFPGAVIPEEETDELVLSPVSVTATADFAAVMARAGVLYRDIDPQFAQAALDAALSAWNYAKNAEMGTGFQNPPEILTGEYPDLYAEDELFWAAAELYLAGELDFSEVESRYGQNIGIEFGWADMAGYGAMDLLYAQEAAGDLQEILTMALTERADAVVRAAAADGFSAGLIDYPWGSNMTVANQGMLLCLAGEVTQNPAYIELAARQRDYLLGVNGPGYCFVTGTGTKSPQHPHHRPSQAAGHVMPGMLSGGPDSYLEDPYAENVLQGLASAMCYADNDQSYSTNEVTVYWNSPLIALLTFLD